MPDRDNLPRSLSQNWKGAEGRAQHGSEHLAEWAAYKIVSKELPKLSGSDLFEALAMQLTNIANRSPTERAQAILESPRNVEKNRDLTQISRRWPPKLAFEQPSVFWKYL